MGVKARMAANKFDIVSICKTKRAVTTDMKHCTRGKYDTMGPVS